MVGLWTRVRRSVPIAPLTTFKIGGPAEYYLQVFSADELVGALQLARERQLPYKILAGGSNVVVADAGIPGLLIHYQCQGLPLTLDGGVLTSEAGVDLANLIDFAIASGLAGLESLSGIPGSVGGAIVGNAGAYGQAISDCLTEVEIFDPDSTSKTGRRWIEKKDCIFAYRESIFKSKSWIILQAKFVLELGDPDKLRARSQEIIEKRKEKYFPGLNCPGSFFKNVLVNEVSAASLAKIDQSKIIDGKIPAGYLLEVVGAKGSARGALRVTDFHGNLIINHGGATCAEVRALAIDLKQLVYDHFGITLQEEVRYLE